MGWRRSVGWCGNLVGDQRLRDDDRRAHLRRIERSVDHAQSAPLYQHQWRYYRGQQRRVLGVSRHRRHWRHLMSVLKARVGGAWVAVPMAGGPDEVFVGPTAPTDSATELWYDTASQPAVDPAKM